MLSVLVLFLKYGKSINIGNVFFLKRTLSSINSDNYACNN